MNSSRGGGFPWWAATAADVLKVDGSDLITRLGETEVGELGVAMDDGLVTRVVEDAVDGGCGILERQVVEGFEFLAAGGEVPVGAGFPKFPGFCSHVGGVKVGEPIEAVF